MIVHLIQKNGHSFLVNEATYNKAFWDRFEMSWDPETFQLYDTVLKQDIKYIDIGAWIGATVLYVARYTRKIFAFEPDPVAYRGLTRNMMLNSHLVETSRCFNIALWTKSGISRLTSTRLGDSAASLVTGNRDCAFVVTADARDLLSSIGVGERTFIKIDVEGAEYDLVAHVEEIIRAFRPDVYISLHPKFLPSQFGSADDFIDGRCRILMLLKPLLGYRRIYAYYGDRLG